VVPGRPGRGLKRPRQRKAGIVDIFYSLVLSVYVLLEKNLAMISEV
jgi:hypothetical protein